MKKVLAALGIVLVVMIGAVAALPALIPAERIKTELSERVRAATGRPFTAGSVSVSVFPALAVQVRDAALGNPDGFSSMVMAKLGALDIRLKVFPLLHGQLEVDSFVVTAPMVALEVNRQGRANWVFGDGTATPPAVTKTGAPQAPAAGGAKASLADLRLNDVRIVNGTVSFRDARAATQESVTAINLAVTLAGLDSPLEVNGGFAWRGHTVALKSGVERLRVLADGAGTTGTKVSVTADPVTVSFTGHLDGASKQIKGAVDLAVPSVRGLTEWTTGKPLAAPGNGFGPLAIKGQLDAVGSRFSFTQAALSLDAIKATGDLAVDTGGVRPAVKGRLDVDALDLNPYLPPENKDGGGGKSAAKAAPSSSASAAAKSDWSDDPIDVSALKAAEADFALTAGSIKIRKLNIGKSALTLALHGGRLTADLSQLALYHGMAKGRVMLDGSKPGVGLDAKASLDGIEAQPFLADAAGFNRLTGTLKADIAVNGTGRSQRQIVGGLGGRGSLAFNNGAILGINLAAMLRNVTTAFTGSGDAQQKTDFAELSGTFLITNGIVSNKDLALKSPLLRVEGAGTADMPHRTVNYRVEPRAVATLEGQGGKADVGGLVVPVIIEGSWDNPTFRPDLAALVKKNAGSLLQKVLGGKSLPFDPSKLLGH